MKFIFTFFTLLLLAQTSLWAQWQEFELTHDNRVREYRLYVPENYQADATGNLIVSLHGLNSPLDLWINTADFTPIADTTNTLIVAPQAVSDFLVGTAWNSGAGIDGLYFPNPGIDDVDFISVLVDELLEAYDFNPERVFVTGFSMGGFMTQRLALELPDKIRAFASVAGTIGAALLPLEPIDAHPPILHIHGTADNVVQDENNLWGLGAQEVIDYWVLNNLLNPEPQSNELGTGSAYLATHYIYTGADVGPTVEYIKVYGLGHIWLGYEQEVSFCSEIWDFFMRSVQNTEDPMGLPSYAQPELKLYPNPVVNQLHIDWSHTKDAPEDIQIFDLNGSLVKSQNFSNLESEIHLDLSQLSAGTYYLKAFWGQQVIFKKIIKN